MMETLEGLGYKAFEVNENGKKYTYIIVEEGIGIYYLVYEEMFDESKNQMVSIQATIGQMGDYRTINVVTPSFERTICTRGAFILGDSICLRPDAEKHERFGKVYCSANTGDASNLEGYLGIKPKYIDYDNNEFVPDIDTNKELLEFLKTGKKLNGEASFVRIPS